MRLNFLSVWALVLGFADFGKETYVFPFLQLL